MSEDERNTKTTQKPEKIITTEHELLKSQLQDLIDLQERVKIHKDRLERHKKTLLELGEIRKETESELSSEKLNHSQKKQKEEDLEKLDYQIEAEATGVYHVNQAFAQQLKKYKERASEYAISLKNHLKEIEVGLEQPKPIIELEDSDHAWIEATEMMAAHDDEKTNELIKTITGLKAKVTEYDSMAKNKENLDKMFAKLNQIKKEISSLINFDQEEANSNSSTMKIFEEIQKEVEKLQTLTNSDLNYLDVNKNQIEQTKKDLSKLVKQAPQYTYMSQTTDGFSVEKQNEIKELEAKKQELSKTPWYRPFKKRKLNKEIKSLEKKVQTSENSYNEAVKRRDSLQSSLFTKVTEVNQREQQRIEADKLSVAKTRTDNQKDREKEAPSITH